MRYGVPPINPKFEPPNPQPKTDGDIEKLWGSIKTSDALDYISEEYHQQGAIPSEIHDEAFKKMKANDIVRLQALIADRERLARKRKPFKCEFGHVQVNKCKQGHPIYSHDTIDGWCCACDADQAFMEAEIERRVKAELKSGNSDG